MPRKVGGGERKKSGKREKSMKEKIKCCLYQEREWGESEGERKI